MSHQILSAFIAHKNVITSFLASFSFISYCCFKNYGISTSLGFLKLDKYFFSCFTSDKYVYKHSTMKDFIGFHSCGIQQKVSKATLHRHFQFFYHSLFSLAFVLKSAQIPLIDSVFPRHARYRLLQDNCAHLQKYFSPSLMAQTTHPLLASSVSFLRYIEIFLSGVCFQPRGRDCRQDGSHA